MTRVIQSRRRTYKGARKNGEARVVVVDPEYGTTEPLPHVERHSPTGFEWGYGGSGPSDLALSILAHHLEVKAVSPMLYQQFKAAFVAHFGDEWVLQSTVIDRWLTERWSSMSEEQIQGDLRA